MYIRRKVYSISALQDELIEKAFSEGYKKGKEDSEKEDKERITTDITKTKSYRGNGRAAIGGISGIVGRAAGVKHATKLSKEGKVTDKEMIKKAGRRAALVGGLGGALLEGHAKQAMRNYYDPMLDSRSKKELLARYAGDIVSNSLASALSAKAGARKNIKERLLKKHLEDNGINAIKENDKKDEE